MVFCANCVKDSRAAKGLDAGPNHVRYGIIGT